MRVATVEGYSTVKWQDTTVEEGKRYYYKVSGEDAFAQEGPQSQPVLVEVDKDLEPPVVESIYSDKQRLNQTACIHVMATDNRNVTWVSLEYKDATGQWFVIGETENIQNGIADFYWDTTQLADGTYKLRARAKDSNGNISGIWNLPDGQYDFGSKEADFTIDNKGISKIQIKETQGHANYVTIKWDSVPEDDFSYFSVEQLIDGEFKEIEKVSSTLGVHVQNLSVSTQYQFRVVGYDDIGNRGIESFVVTVSTTKDDVAPVVSQFGPAGKYFNAQIPISIQARDNVGIKKARLEYCLNTGDWNLLDERELETEQKEYTYSYTFDVSTFEEGKVSVRAYFYDEEGNVSQSNGVPIENYFYIDHTAPQQVKNVSAEGLGGYISLTWDKPEETDIAGFHIYRADKGKENYQIIARNVTSYKYYDSAVYYGKGYSYKIVAVDFTENESELSEEAVAVAEHDRENPVIHGVTPADGTALSGNVELTAAVTDNARVETVMFECRNKSEQEEVWTDIGTATVGERTGYPSVIWDVSKLDNCDYEVKVLALDAEGNASNSYLVSYAVDTVPPEVPELKAKGIGYGVELTWDVCKESDFYYFELSGKRVTDETYTVLATTTSLSYVHKNLKPDKTYEYILAVYDKAGNRAEGEKVTAVPTDEDTEEPVAFCSENMSVRAGSELLLDAIGSFDNVRVTEYLWDFGDGTSGEGAIAKHKYKDMGTYKGKLTVKDKAGNVGTQDFTVYVRSRISAKISIRVNNISGNYRYSLPFAYLYVEKDGKGTVYNADSFGELDLILDAGDYIIKAYSEGYMPTSKKLSVKTGEEMKMDISLEKGELVTGSIKTKRLTLEQLQDLGVDLQDENNWYTYTYTFDYKESSAVTQYTATLTPGKTVEFAETENHSSGGSSTTSTPTGGAPTFYGRMDTFHGKKVVTIYRTYSYLKKMYEVDLEVTNHAEAGNGFDIVGSTATLNLPEGLSFLKTTARQKPTIELGTLEAQKSKTAVWYIRADKPGSYSLSAQFNGTLMPFEASVFTLIKAEKPLLVTEEEDNTFTDEGFVTDNSRKYSIKVTNKYGEPLKGAILTLSNGDKKCMTITNSYGNAVLEVNEHDMREFKLRVECEGYLPYDETYELDIDTYYDTIILYREGEIQEPPDEKKWDENPYLGDSYDIKMIKATLDAKDIIQYEGTINCILNCSSSFGFQFDKKITGYKLIQGNKVLAESDSVNADNIRVNVPAKEFTPDEEVVLQVNGAKDKTAVYSLHVVCVKQIYKRVELEYGNSTFNLLTEAAGINTHDNNGYKDVKINCWTENSVEDVACYELIQGSDVVASSENGEFELFSKLFKPYIWVYLVAYDENNERIDCQRIYLNVSGTLDLGNIFLQMVGVDTIFGEDADLLNGLSFSLPKGKFLLDYEISYSDDGVEISFNPTEEDLDEGEGNAATKVNEFINKKFPDWLTITPSGTLKGAYESGKDSAQLKLTGDINLSIAVSFEKEIQAIPTPPIVVKMGIETTATIGGEGELALPIKGGEEPELELAIIYAFEIALSLSAGIGIAEIASVGIYGGASLGVEGKIAPELAVDNLKLGGNAGIEASLFGFTEEFELISGEWVLYDREKEEQLENQKKANSLSLQIGEYESALYDAENYDKNPLEEERSSEWNGSMGNVEKDCINLLKTNTGISLQTKMITCKDTTMLVFTDKKLGRSWRQSSALFYSLYDKEEKTWSEPKEVISNDNPDFNPDVTTDGEHIYVAWNEANEQADNADNLVEASKCMEVRVAAYHADRDEFTAFAPLTNNEKCENHIQIAALDGKPVVTWVENDQDNPFGTEGTNQIKKAELSEGVWNIETLASVEGMITSMDAGRLNDRLYVAYAQDNNSVIIDTDDQMLTLIDLSTNEERTLAEKNVRNVAFTMFDKEPVLSWCQDGKVHAISNQDDNSSVIYDKANIGTGVYNIMGDDKGNCGIYYVSTKDYSSQIYFSQYDKESRQWGAPVNVTSQHQYLRSPSAVYVDETPLMSFGCEEAQWNQEEKLFDVKETGNLCCMSLSSSAKPMIEDVTYQSEEAIPGGNVDLNVVLKNSGIAVAKDVTVFVVDETGDKVSEQEYQADILTGDKKNFNIIVSLPYTLVEHNYQVFVAADGNESEAYELILGYADLEIGRRILIQNGQYLIEATVTNQGICPAAGKVEFYNFDNPAEVLHSEAIGMLNYGEQEMVTWKVDDAYVKDVAQYNVGIQVKTDSKQMNTKNDMKIASLYGSPKQITYGITFDYQMDAYKNAFSVTDIYGRVMFPSDPVKSGYQFIGWYCNGARYTTMSIFKEDMTLIPRWSNNVPSEPEPTLKPTPKPKPTPTPFKGESQGDNEGTQIEPQVKKGDYVKYNGFVYKVTSISKSSRTVTLEKPVKLSSIKEAVIPSSIKINGATYKVNKIAKNAFKNCKKLKKVVIGANVTHIGSRAFYGCRNLTSIKLKTYKLKVVGKDAWKGTAKNIVVRFPKKKKKQYKKLLTNKGLKKTVKYKLY